MNREEREVLVNYLQEKMRVGNVQYLERVCQACGTRYVRVEYRTELFANDESDSYVTRETCPNLCPGEVNVYDVIDGTTSQRVEKVGNKIEISISAIAGPANPDG